MLLVTLFPVTFTLSHCWFIDCVCQEQKVNWWRKCWHEVIHRQCRIKKRLEVTHVIIIIYNSVICTKLWFLYPPQRIKQHFFLQYISTELKFFPIIIQVIWKTRRLHEGCRSQRTDHINNCRLSLLFLHSMLSLFYRCWPCLLID